MQGETKHEKRRRNSRAMLLAHLDQLTAGMNDRKLAREFQRSQETMIDFIGFLEMDPDFLEELRSMV